MEYIKSVHSLLFPTKNWCYFCRENSSNIEGYICCDCKSNLDKVDKETILDGDYINKTYYILSFNRFIREIIHGFKFGGKSYLYKPLGEIMVNTIKSMGIEKQIDIIYFVPSHPRKEAIRGYNQSELLAKYISKELNIELSKGNLIKTQHTKEQSHLNKFDRMINLKDSFKIKRPGQVSGKRILLIDDLVTTGATFMECGKVLKNNGAKEIIALALTSSKIM